jgi:hypothetical protein
MSQCYFKGRAENSREADIVFIISANASYVHPCGPHFGVELVCGPTCRGGDNSIVDPSHCRTQAEVEAGTAPEKRLLEPASNCHQIGITKFEVIP